MANKAMVIRFVVMVMVVVVGRPVVGPMPWITMNSRGIQLVSLKGINLIYLVIISIGLMGLTKKI